MESWRRQVIAVQSVSIREAEAKAREVLEQVSITVYYLARINKSVIF